MVSARIALAYFVGGCLFAAAASLIFRTLDWLAATLLGVMFVIFVTTMHVPGAIKTGEHYAWIVALRDLSFGGGAMAYAGALGVGRLRDGSSWRHARPTHRRDGVRGVWRPALPAANAHARSAAAEGDACVAAGARAVGLRDGRARIAAGGFLLLNRQTREVAGALGLVIVAIVLVVYVPFVGVAVEGGEKLEALNYVWDTLLFAGAVLLVGVGSRRP